jgi:hypothetical protein
MSETNVLPINKDARIAQLWESHLRALNRYNAEPNMANAARMVDAYKARHREFVGTEFTY